jgi:opacity protein-like surface antigen
LRIGVAAALASLSGASAQAADALAAPPAGNWSGIYAGLNFGYGWDSTRDTFPNTNFYTTAPGQSFASSPSGVLAGAHIDWNAQLGSWVLGLEGTLDASGGSQTQVGVLVPGIYLYDRFTTGITDLETINARLGYASGPWLGYIKGGFATGGVDFSAISGVPIPGVTASGNGRANGWDAGIGFEKMVTPNIALGLEYDYASLNGSFTIPISNGYPSTTINETVAVSSLLARVSMKFY